MDAFGTHELSCKTGGCLGVRHNAVREAFMRSCLDAGVKDVCREKEGLFENSSERPANVYLPPAFSSLCVKYFENRPLCLDFAVTHTQQPSFLKIACEHSGSAADRYAASLKLPRYEKIYKAQGLDQLFWCLVRSADRDHSGLEADSVDGNLILSM